MDGLARMSFNDVYLGGSGELEGISHRAIHQLSTKPAEISKGRVNFADNNNNCQRCRGRHFIAQIGIRLGKSEISEKSRLGVCLYGSDSDSVLRNA